MTTMKLCGGIVSLLTVVACGPVEPDQNTDARTESKTAPVTVIKAQAIFKELDARPPREARAALSVAARFLTATDRQTVSSKFADAMGLPAQAKQELVDISGSSKLFVTQFAEVLKPDSAPASAKISHPEEPDTETGNPDTVEDLFSFTDWGCLWQYGEPNGSEVGPDFWPAAWLCFLAAYYTGQSSYLVVHQHTAYFPYIEVSAPVWSW